MTVEYIVGIDPGPEQSATCVITSSGNVVTFAKHDNDVDVFVQPCKTVLAIEMIASYGMPVGREVFDTCIWIGRYIERGRQCSRLLLITRNDIKLELCKSPRANDATIRQALIDIYGPGKARAIGTKQQPGPLYGMAGDCWSALAVAVVAQRRIAQ